MASYKVLSDRVADKKAGDTISDAELDGFNVDALIEGQHIEAIAAKASKSNGDE
jgi:hypothetical protein